jgi:serine protease Do
MWRKIMNRMTRRALPLLALPLVVAAAACGSDADGATTTTAASQAPVTTVAATTPPTTAATPTTDAPTPSTQATSTGINSYSDVQPAVVQIVARGTFRDPEIGYADGSGLGSGFLISDDGLVVTNNHVVAGAATLEVYVGGELDKSYNAKVLGVSECNDLAVIKLNTNDDMPHLDWYDGEIKAGLDVYAAGYPLGDPEFTLTKGIIAKAKAGGDLTGTSSIDHTVEHDANIQPGNSGGPLVDSEGKVVAINYAGGAQVTTTEQFYGIASDLAQPVVEQLETGNFESLGINGWAVADDASGITGIWVAGVSAGSPAADAGIQPGDIVTALNGLPMGMDGTFKDYCDVIRTAGEGTPMAVEVLRYDTSEVLKGEINGDKPLEQAFSFAEEVGDEVGDDSGAAAPAYDYETVVDDTNQIQVALPTAWTDRTTAPSDKDGVPVPYIAASTSMDGFINGFTAPGLLFAKLPATADLDAELAAYGFPDDCINGGITPYSDPVFTGKYQLWQDCGGTTNDVVTLVAVPADSSYLVMIQAQITTDADLAALQEAFDSFNTVS